MEIKAFVEATLKEVLEATKEASDSNDEFYLDTATSKGVHFDLAVTYSSSATKSKGADAGFRIRVIGAGVNQKSDTNEVQESVSRIKFNIMHVDRAKQRQFRQVRT